MFGSIEKVSALYTSEEKKGLSPMEIQLAIQEESDRITDKYTSKKPDELKGEDYAIILNEIETLKKMAEKFANEKLNAYLENALAKIEDHKKLVSKSNFKDIASFKRVPDPKKPQIGTHR